MTGPHSLEPRSPSGRRPRTPSWREPGCGSSCRPRPALFQWLKQIEGTEAALTQKMLDLEKEKVSAGAGGGGWRGSGASAPPRPGKPGVRFPLLICTRFSGFCPGAIWVTNDHPSTSLFTYYMFRASLLSGPGSEVQYRKWGACCRERPPSPWGRVLMSDGHGAA